MRQVNAIHRLHTFVSYDSIIGNVCIGDSNNNRIRKVTVSTGVITTVAGTGSASYGGDNGQATSAGLNYPRGVALDTSGNYFYLYTTVY